MKAKCYISGKITGLHHDQYSALFNEAKKKVAAMGFIPVNPLELTHEHDKTWGDFMKADLKALMDCDYIYVLNNWRDSKGAVIEVNTAVSLGINVIFQENKLNKTTKNNFWPAFILGLGVGVLGANKTREI